MDDPEASRVISDFAAEAARRTGLDAAQAAEGRHELESHLFEAARSRATDGSIRVADALQAVAALGEGWRAFFPSAAAPLARAGWGPRMGAAAIDYALFVVAVVLAFGTVVAVACAPQSDCGLDHEVLPWPMVESDGGLLGELLSRLEMLTVFAGPALVFGLLEHRLGATPGKLAMGLRVVTLAGGPVPLAQALGRNASKVLLPVPFLVPVLLLADTLAARPWRGGERFFARWTSTQVVVASSAAVPAPRERAA